MTRDVNVLIPWLLTVVVIAAIGATAIPIIYSFLPWNKHLIGRMFMLQATSLAAAIDLTIVMYFWNPDILIRFWVQMFVYTAIAISTSMLAWATFRTRYPKKRSFKLLFNASVYEFLKRLVQVILPAAGGLYFGLAQLWNLPHVAAVVGTIALVTTFLGLCLGVSTKEFQKQEPKYDGLVIIEENDDGQQARFQVDPKTFVEKDQLVLKVNR